MLVKPLSFMNDSGRPLGKIARWWKTPPEDLLVVVDDLDLPFGKLRMRETGSSGGHNGLKSIIEYFGTGFPRLRVGIGRSGYEAIDHVLSTLSRRKSANSRPIVVVAADGVLRWLERGPVEAMNLVNAWQPEARRNAPGAPTTENDD